MLRTPSCRAYGSCLIFTSKRFPTRRRSTRPGPISMFLWQPETFGKPTRFARSASFGRWPDRNRSYSSWAITNIGMARSTRISPRRNCLPPNQESLFSKKARLTLQDVVSSAPHSGPIIPSRAILAAAPKRANRWTSSTPAALISSQSVMPAGCMRGRVPGSESFYLSQARCPWSLSPTTPLTQSA